jgi:hypothetical protein
MVTIMSIIVRPIVYAAVSAAIIAYIYNSYPLERTADIPFTQLTVRQLVNNIGFIFAMLFGIILGGGIIHASFSNNVDQDRGYLLVVLALAFLFQHSEEFMGDTFRAIRAIIAWLNGEFVGRLF